MKIRRLHGVRTPHRKHTKDLPSIQMNVPGVVTIPMSMHIGSPAKPVVQPGDGVKVGQLIGEAGGFVSAPIHASVSGKVKRIEDIVASNGRYQKAIVIESDGLQTPFEGLKKPMVTDTESFLAAVRESGVVGLGGAGFPTAVKLKVEPSRIEAIIVNGAECEPYITSDTRTMLDRTDSVLSGIRLIQTYLMAKRIIIAIENNKKECIEAFRRWCQTMTGVEVMALPPLYPQGGEKVLIYHTTGRIVPEGGLPIDAGAIVLNCTTLAAIADYIETGMPLVEKIVTVDGSAVREPKNVTVPIGTPLSDVFAFCGGFREEPKKVLYGGPMMGIAVPDLAQPILKNTNAILALAAKDADFPEPTACIKCGRCAAHCPLSLSPVEISTAFEQKTPERLARLKANLCMECGCCNFICPARRPLVQTNKLAKAMLIDYLATQKKEKEAVPQ